jgi:MoxR-like ATPase
MQDPLAISFRDLVDDEDLLYPASRPASAANTCSTLLLCRTTRKLVGREQLVLAILGSLQDHGAAVIWGSPGEGKTAVAAEAGCRLQTILQPTFNCLPSST